MLKLSSLSALFIHVSHQAGFDTRSFYSGVMEGSWCMSQDLCTAGHCSSYVHSVQCELILVIVKTPGMKPGDLAGHRFTRSEGLMQCKSILVLIATRYKCQVAHSWSHTLNLTLPLWSMLWCNENMLWCNKSSSWCNKATLCCNESMY